ncbi:DHA2 family efflux MFS transporter permease subunit [Patulibacter americanus]|uniref:DHA2 family efflux MFS transporter permease subunit n=1 Tax=Patulibacter americanus TaxID=588672 RepID=UPI0003B497FD|nr:DHA2 family efflux MFS transporter permease subunit [Patulibacter americanus]
MDDVSPDLRVQPAGGADARTKRLTLLACVLGSTIVMIDGSVVNVALPSIRGDLGGGLAGQQWVTNAYLLTLGSLLLVAGSLGDVLGERRVFLLGVAGFGVTSVLCALAPTIEVLVIGRALQGAAGAALTPAALAVIVATFDASERNRAIGTWTAWGGIGAAVGPVLGGWLVDVASWHWVFLINVPLVLGTLLLIARVIPRPAPAGPGAPSTPARRLDLPGALLCALGLGGITFGLIQQPLSGWGAPDVAGPLVAGVLLLAVFVAYEDRTADPMLPLGLFRRRNFVVGNVETFVMYGGLSLLSFYLVIFLQQVAGWDALEAGAALLPVTAVMLVAAGRFGGLADRYGPRFFMGVGPLIAGSGLLLLLRMDADVSYVTDLLPAVALFALGLSMTVAPLTATVLADAEARNAGAASGVNNAIARVAGLVAIAGVGVVVASSFAGDVDARLGDRPLSAAGERSAAELRDGAFSRPDTAGLPADEAATLREAARGASVESFRVGMGISGGLVILGGLVGAAGIRNPRREVASADCGGGQWTGQPCDAANPEATGELAAAPVRAG